MKEPINSILWIQSDSQSADHLFVNGKYVNDSKSALYRGASQILYKKEKFGNKNSENMKASRRELNSPNLTLYSNLFIGYLYKSTFNESASDGRKKTFVYWTTNQINVPSQVSKLTSSLNYTLKENEMFFVNDYFKKCSKRQKYYAMALIAIFGVIIYLVLKN